MSIEQQMYRLCDDKNVACRILQGLQRNTDNNYARILTISEKKNSS